MQLKLSQTFQYLRGSILSLFFFENDIEDFPTTSNISNRKYLGFIESKKNFFENNYFFLDFKGLSVEIITSGEGPLVQMTIIRAQIHDGKTKKSLENLAKRNVDDSCQTHKFKDLKKNIWINVKDGVLSIKFSDTKMLVENCLTVKKFFNKFFFKDF